MFGPTPSGVELVPWSMTEKSPDMARLNAVLVPNRFDMQAGYPLLEETPNLSFIQLTSAGYDDVLPLIPEGVTVSNGRGIHDDETAELAVGLLLASMRGIDVAVKDMADQQWRSVFRPSLADRKVLLVGHGAIGKAIAARLEPFRVQLTAVARSARPDENYPVTRSPTSTSCCPTPKWLS